MPVRFRWVAAIAFGTFMLFCAPGFESAPLIAQPTASPAPDEFAKTIVPFVEKFCVKCHNSDDNSGGVALDVFKSAAHAKKDRKTWEAVERVVRDGEMPPKKKAQPEKAERLAIADYLGGTLLKVSCVGPKDPGRVTVRRLNKAEYSNTIRDLCGVGDFNPAEDFPSDDVGYGFDNIGDVLSVQPILVEKYLAAAEKILDKALAVAPPANQVFKGQELVVFPREAKNRETKKIAFTTDGTAFVDKFNFPAQGEYLFKIKAWGNKVGDDKAKLSLRIDGKEVKSFEVEAPADKAITLEFKISQAPGERRVAMVFANPFEDKSNKAFRTLGLDRMEIEGPLNVAHPILIAKPEGKDDKKAAAEKVIASFARKAYRRPLKAGETARLLKLFEIAEKQGEKFEQAIKLPLKAILCSPHFLFRIEDDAKLPETSRTLNDFELATRLSYFLWSSMPDAELFQLAEKGELRKPGVLKAQVTRMLKDWKSQSLKYDFAGQWLMLRSVWGVSPDTGAYPNWDDKLKSSMIRETEQYFDYIVKQDRPITEFLDSDYTFVNERLAKHYGMTGVRGEEFRKIALVDNRRGGVLTQASVLTVTSNPTRTSPVKRGKWVLENLLASPPPPPPPNIPELEKTELKGTLRQQMEQHRANPACASCHEKMDPIGFGLENFDGIGAWRTEEKKTKLDASGVLPGGVKFDGPGELRKILLGKSEMFRRCLAEKLLTFAIGRGMEYYDKCILDELALKTKAGGDRFSALVLAIVESEPFQQRNAKRTE